MDTKPVLAGGHFTKGWVYAVTARLDEAREEVEETLRISRAAGDRVYESLSLFFIGMLHNWAGEYPEAARLHGEALGIAREHRLLLPNLQALFGYGLSLTGKGDYDAAIAIFEEGLALSEKVGAELRRLRLLNCLGWIHSECGDLDLATELNRQAFQGARKRGDDPETIANSEINLADIFMAKGDLVLAQEFLEGVHRLAKDPATSEWMKWRYSTHLFASLGELWLAKGDPPKAREFADQCLDIATRTNSQKNLVKGWRLRGEIAAARRQWADAEEAFRQALAIAQAIGNPTQLWKTHLAFGRLHAEARRPEAARQAYEAARQVIDEIKANLRHPGLRSSLENAPTIRRVYDLAGPA